VCKYYLNIRLFGGISISFYITTLIFKQAIYLNTRQQRAPVAVLEATQPVDVENVLRHEAMEEAE